MSTTPRPPAPDRVRPVAWRVLAWCGAITYPVVLFVTMHDGRHGFTAVEVLPSAALTVLVVTLLRRRPLPALALLLIGWFVATVAMDKAEIGFLQSLITDLAVGFIAATRSRQISIAAAAMALVVQFGSAAFFASGSNVLSTAVAIVLALVVAWMVGNSIRERRQHAEELASQAAAQAVTAERLRIARELHDMVAHSIGIIAIQAGVGSRVIDTQPAEARDALSAIEATSRETLSGLRRMLGALRRAEPGSVAAAAPLDPAPGLADLDRLAATTMKAGVRVDVQWRGERRPLPPDIDLSAFRIIQEAVTNVVRHAGTQHCRVSIDYRDEELFVEVVDDGRGHGTTGTGYGLVGMRERVGLLNGRLTAGPRPEGGFRVEARLPLPAGSL